MTENAPEPVKLVRGATTALLEALSQGPIRPRPDLDGSGPHTAILDELARLGQLVAVLAGTATGRRSNEVERAAGELAAALVAMRDDTTRNDVRP
ncbi:MAG: hypothetical protein QOE59_3054 [Actinomycetota bacterium]|jgi:hypothetical protein|nr:hypothetical protein [Actinomycetota bacterium]